MRTTLDYLNAAKSKLRITSDRALANWLGVSQPAVTQYQSGRRVIDNYVATKIAVALGIDPLEVIAAAEFEREKEGGRKKYWENFSQEIVGAPASPSISRTGGRQKNPAATAASRTTLDYLNRAAERLGLASDPALARWLGVSPETLSACRNGAAALDDYAAAKIADALDLDPLEVIAVANLERSEPQAERQDYWRKVFAKCTAAGVFLAFLLTSNDLNSQKINEINPVPVECILC